MNTCARLPLDEQDSRVRMALLSEKLQAMHAAQDAHVRQFDDPAFHFVPRRKMMQIQVSGGVLTFPPNVKWVKNKDPYLEGNNDSLFTHILTTLCGDNGESFSAIKKKQYYQ